MTTKKLAPLFSSLLALAPLLFAAEAAAIPKAGSKELRIGQQLQPPLTLTDGFIRLEPETGSGSTGLGMGAGMGYFVTDGIELGTSLSLQMMKTGDADAIIGPGLTPFARFMFFSGKIGVFAELVAEFRRLSNDNGSSTVFGFGADLGLEIFVTDDWAVRLAPTYRHLVITNSANVGSVEVSNDTSGDRFGMTWGLAAYF